MRACGGHAAVHTPPAQCFVAAVAAVTSFSLRNKAKGKNQWQKCLFASLLEYFFVIYAVMCVCYLFLIVVFYTYWFAWVDLAWLGFVLWFSNPNSKHTERTNILLILMFSW